MVILYLVFYIMPVHTPGMLHTYDKTTQTIDHHSPGTPAQCGIFFLAWNIYDDYP